MLDVYLFVTARTFFLARAVRVFLSSLPGGGQTYVCDSTSSFVLHPILEDFGDLNPAGMAFGPFGERRDGGLRLLRVSWLPLLNKAERLWQGGFNQIVAKKSNSQ